MKKIALALVALVAFFGLTGSAFAADPVAPCKACHDLSKGGKRKVGPALWGVYNRAPSIKDVPFKTWDDAALNTWLSGPRKVKPSTPMSFPGFKDQAQRDAAIAFLKTMKD